MLPQYCKIRDDLLGDVGVPIMRYGKVMYYCMADKLQCRWERKDRFQVFYDHLWWNAESIDFDFINTR